MLDRQTAREQVKAQERELRRSIIFNGAMKAFAAHGFEATTMDHIAAMVGLAKGTLYKSFTSKEELFLSLMTTLLGHQLEFLEAVLVDEQLTVRDRLSKCLHALLRPEGSLVNARTVSISVTPQMFAMAPEESQRSYLAALEQTEGVLLRYLQLTRSSTPSQGSILTPRLLLVALNGFKNELALRSCLDPIWEQEAHGRTESFVALLLESILGKE